MQSGRPSMPRTFLHPVCASAPSPLALVRSESPPRSGSSTPMRDTPALSVTVWMPPAARCPVREEKSDKSRAAGGRNRHRHDGGGTRALWRVAHPDGVGPSISRESSTLRVSRHTAASREQQASRVLGTPLAEIARSDSELRQRIARHQGLGRTLERWTILIGYVSAMRCSPTPRSPSGRLKAAGHPFDPQEQRGWGWQSRGEGHFAQASPQ